MTVGSFTPQRLLQFVRMVLATALIGVAFGAFLQMLGRVTITTATAAEFAARGAIVGAAFWAFEIFYVSAPAGGRLAAMSFGRRVAVKIITYIVLIEAGLLIGQVIFQPDQPFRFLPFRKAL